MHRSIRRAITPVLGQLTTEAPSTPAKATLSMEIVDAVHTCRTLAKMDATDFE